MPYQQLMDDADMAANKSKKSFQNGGFVAGSLVHTKEGLVSIEKIKVGDWVLSKPKSGEGELAYKRVTKTFVHDNKEVWLLKYSKNPGVQAILVGSPSWGGDLIAMINHPFFVKGKGWIEVKDLKTGDVLVTTDDSDDTVFDNRYELRETEVHNISWAYTQPSICEGVDVSFSVYPYEVSKELYSNEHAIDVRGG